MKALLTLLLLTLLSITAQAQQVLRSGVDRASLIELYTSEGCSSCPTADRWYSQLLNHPQLWSQVVPVAWHVDYWNYLGWEDPFAQRKFSNRQRQYAREGHSSSVYTPGLFVLGREWRSWRYDRPVPIAAGTVGVLQVKLDGDEFEASFSPATEQAGSARILNLALLGIGLETRVRAGENRGKSLRHDFVVLDSRAYHSDNHSWRGAPPNHVGNHQPQRLAWAAWVNAEGTLTPLQVTGGWSTGVSVED